MSYILDALKRADAERERGAVPGLHTRQVTSPVSQAAGGAQQRLWLVLAAVLALGAMAAGVWFWQTPASAVRLAAVTPAEATPPVPAPAAPIYMPAPAPDPGRTPASASPSAPPVAAPAPRAAAPAPSAVTPAAPRPAARPPPPPAVAMQAPPPRPRTEPVARTAEPDASARSAQMPLPARTPAGQGAAAAVPLLSELSEDLRRQIPPLAITGSVYSENPVKRLLLVNNQVLPQGAVVAPEVNLEEIRARSSVFSFRGTRFRLAH